jgi:hypothetical protein
MLYVWTAPWQSLSCSVEHVLKSSTKGAQKKRLEAWKDAKKTEFTYVSFAVSLLVFFAFYIMLTRLGLISCISGD